MGATVWTESLTLTGGCDQNDEPVDHFWSFYDPLYPSYIEF